jgi:hypothetical protein
MGEPHFIPGIFNFPGALDGSNAVFRVAERRHHRAEQEGDFPASEKKERPQYMRPFHLKE